MGNIGKLEDCYCFYYFDNCISDDWSEKAQSVEPECSNPLASFPLYIIKSHSTL